MSKVPVLYDNSEHSEILKTLSCVNPFVNFQIDHKGNVLNCCYTWLKTFSGNVYEKSLLQILSDELQADIRCSTTDGSFKYCNAKLCPSLVEYVHNKKLTGPLMHIEELATLDKRKLTLNLDYDFSCNLYCGSCRTERILHSIDGIPRELKSLHAIVLEDMRVLMENGYELTVQLTGSGDPFASVLYWDYLKNIKEEDNLVIRLATNGNLMTKEKFSYPFADKIDYVNVSVDAFSEETYKKVRRGGNFKALKKNLTDLDDLISEGRFPHLYFWRPNFIVQDLNFQEMAEYAHWMLEFKRLDVAWFNLIAQWDHISDEEFAKKAVWNERHPQHEEFLKILSDPVFDNPKIHLGNVAQLRNKL